MFPTRFSLAEILVLVGTAGAGRMALSSSTRISAWMKCVQGHCLPRGEYVVPVPADTVDQTRFSLAEILVLVGTAGAGGMAPSTSIRISARLKRVAKWHGIGACHGVFGPKPGNKNLV